MERKCKAKTCPVCKEVFQPRNSLQKVCNYQCAIKWNRQKQKAKDKAAKAKSEREQRKATAKAKERLKTLSDWLREAQQAFNAYIRERDSGQPCISCQKNTGAKMNAGHYRSVGSSPQLRFNEMNCHIQCEHCNSWKSGNAIDYRINLVKKIGLEAVETLESDQEPKRYRIDDAKAIKEEYKIKLKELRQTKG